MITTIIDTKLILNISSEHKKPEKNFKVKE
jgi:hypothetical protein